jgi:hypothetical protein
MRAIVLSLVGLAGMVGFATAAPAAPTAAPRQIAANPAITQVWQRCGHGFHRANGAWQSKSGGWNGACVPNKPKTAMASPAEGATTEQLNRQELVQHQAGAPPAR